MYSKLKDTIRAAGHTISKGGAILPSDFQALKDYAYIEGTNYKQLIADAHAEAKAPKTPVKAAPVAKAVQPQAQAVKAVVAPPKAPEAKTEAATPDSTKEQA